MGVGPGGERILVPGILSPDRWDLQKGPGAVPPALVFINCSDTHDFVKDGSLVRVTTGWSMTLYRFPLK